MIELGRHLAVMIHASLLQVPESFTVLFYAILLMRCGKSVDWAACSAVVGLDLAQSVISSTLLRVCHSDLKRCTWYPIVSNYCELFLFGAKTNTAYQVLS